MEMIILKFNIVIKLLLDITNTKSKDLAKFVGFDNSYISKWLSGNRLPSSKSLDVVLDNASDFFAKSIYDKNLQGEFAQLSLHKLKDDSLESVRDAVYKLMKKSYLNSKEDFERPKLTIDPRSFVAYGIEEVLTKAFRAITDTLYASKYDVDLYTTFDWSRIMSDDFTGTLNLQQPMIDKILRTHVIMDRNIAPNYTDEEFFNSLMLTLMGTYLNAQWYLPTEEKEDLNIIFCDNRFVMLFTLDDHYEPFLSYTEDPKTINSVRNSLIKRFDQNVTLNSNQDERVYVQRMIRDQKEISVLTVYPSGLFIDWILEKHITPEMPAIRFHNAVNIYSKLVSECTFNLFITERGIAEFLETGNIDFLNQIITLNHEERMLYIQTMVTHIKNNHGLTVYIINNKEFMRNFDSINISMYANDNNLFFKKHLSYYKEYPDTNLYKYIDDPHTASLYHIGIKKLADRDDVIKVNYENVDEVFESLCNKFVEQGLWDKEVCERIKAERAKAESGEEGIGEKELA